MSRSGDIPDPDAGAWSRELRAEPIGKILIIKWSAMGDVVIASATMQDLREAFPEATLHLNTMQPWDRLFEGDPRFAHVFCFDLRGRERGLLGHLRWLRYVRSQGYDLVVDLQCTDHTRLLLGLLPLVGAKIPYRLSFYRRYPYNIAPRATADLHHTREYAVAALAAGGVPAPTERPVFHLPEERRRAAEALLARHGLRQGDYVVFLPGCTAEGYLKRWGASRYSVLAERLHRSGLGKVVLLGGPDEVEECRRIERRCGPWLVNLCGQTELLDLIPICGGARLVVGNDTGTAHMAAASATPMVIICGPTDPRRVRPLGRAVTTLQVDLPCINCYRKHCAHHSCMRLITPDDVLARVQASVAPPSAAAEG